MFNPRHPSRQENRRSRAEVITILDPGLYRNYMQFHEIRTVSAHFLDGLFELLTVTD